MKITVTYDETVVQLECYQDMELENFVAYCEAEMGQSFANLQLIHNATPLLNMSKTLKEMNIHDGDMILVVSKALLASHAQQQLQQQQQALNQPQAQQQAGSNTHTNQPGPSQAFPLDIEAQRLIHEEIQREQIENNMAAAIEYLPESFGSINMLYIKCKVNGVPLEAFVDSGAQSTIMSKACAERCNMMRLIDKRFSGVAKGVGESIIIGKIHMCQIQIENDFLPSSFNVLEDQPMEVLLGLDMLKRHQCIIDLRKGSLTIGTTGTETKFLNDAELPDHARRIARGEQ